MSKSGLIKMVCPEPKNLQNFSEEKALDLEFNINTILNGKNNGKDLSVNLTPQYYALSFNSFTENFYVINSIFEPTEGIYHSQLTSWKLKRSNLKLTMRYRMPENHTKDVTSFFWNINTDMQIDDKVVIFLTRFGGPFEVCTLL